MISGLAVGEPASRRDIHERFGGRRQGGISPSRESPVVMLFTDPRTGYQQGYYDRGRTMASIPGHSVLMFWDT